MHGIIADNLFKWRAKQIEARTEYPGICKKCSMMPLFFFLYMQINSYIKGTGFRQVLGKVGICCCLCSL